MTSSRVKGWRRHTHFLVFSILLSNFYSGCVSAQKTLPEFDKLRSLELEQRKAEYMKSRVRLENGEILVGLKTIPAEELRVILIERGDREAAEALGPKTSTKVIFPILALVGVGMVVWGASLTQNQSYGQAPGGGNLGVLGLYGIGGGLIFSGGKGIYWGALRGLNVEHARNIHNQRLQASLGLDEDSLRGLE